jgi:hypothetical protein
MIEKPSEERPEHEAKIKPQGNHPQRGPEKGRVRFKGKQAKVNKGCISNNSQD